MIKNPESLHLEALAFCLLKAASAIPLLSPVSRLPESQGQHHGCLARTKAPGTCLLPSLKKRRNYQNTWQDAIKKCHPLYDIDQNLSSGQLIFIAESVIQWIQRACQPCKDRNKQSA
ncbi:hypothetical protein [Endozoicomonas sp. SCSIO W0465]|uniref:hypothetical protein n=1 Tax=Endozoicomonas sp. SCSIO W0465 TaxID=2918516 RepID=UPI002074C3FD|nr:hypothetical protein [Endozoicomonas sp. SCSIO W0465]USE37162.1 hypothetical protein MJO57_02725 [Endozoicomonas sp. SCSIO W0465]